jgi:hypothetical protein
MSRHAHLLLCGIVCFSLLLAVCNGWNQTGFALEPSTVTLGDTMANESNLDEVVRVIDASDLVHEEYLGNRLLLTSTLLGILLGQLSVLYGYLKINHATRGFYSGRMQSIAAVTSITVLAIGYFFYVSWMT